MCARVTREHNDWLGAQHAVKERVCVLVQHSMAEFDHVENVEVEEPPHNEVFRAFLAVIENCEEAAVVLEAFLLQGHAVIKGVKLHALGETDNFPALDRGKHVL